jgi:hypothetical protein
MQNMFSVKIELRKLANSENFANSEIAPEAFADSEPGAKFSVFPKNCQFVSRVRSGYWGVIFTIFYAINTLYNI